ncbi:MAG: FecR family protein [Chitinophagaceae bacterium]|nr:FecR family protein [Chitinophagaceae bacterium]
MPVRLSVEELVINDSFINYCLERNEQDVLHWLQYQEDHPDGQDIIEEAKQLVFLMTGSLQGLAAGTPAAPVFPIKRFPLLKVMGWAAACTGIVLTTYFVFRQKKDVRMPSEVASAENPLIFTTKAGAKQTITLPDGTKVYLNSGSTLKLSNGFGKTDRNVFLVGEGGFDVIHNSRLPFTVSVDKYDVNVTGTFFNVRAYPGDKITETSLLRGKIDILIKNGSSTPLRMSLKPKQKFVLDVETGGQIKGSSDDPGESENKAAPHVAIEALSYNRDSVNIETAWIQNTLIIEEETFEMIREKLERWYNVRLIFKDEKVKQYGFTGTFRNESIEQVLKAFKDSYFFNYTIEGTDIIISK